MQNVQFVRKLRQKGPLGVLKALVWRMEAPIGRLRRRLEDVGQLRKADHTAVFAREGGTRITLPRGSVLRGLLGLDPTLVTSADFLRSATSEALLRHLVFRLLGGGHIDPAGSIVDVGCWCGDNTLAWARCLGDGAVVHAIDPSAQNLAYAQALARANGITNVTWVQAVCADHAGHDLGYTGPIGHARFHDAKETDTVRIPSSTLDRIVGPEGRASIALMHVDVEGFEARVLRGAAGIIDQSRPVIICEQHLCDDGTQAVFDFLALKDYAVFMVNEIIPQCRADCRNLMAFPNERPVPAELTGPPADHHDIGHVPAVPGPYLLPYTPHMRGAAPPQAERP